MKTRFKLLSMIVLGCSFVSGAVPVKVTMNTVSTTMSFAEKSTGKVVETGEPVARVYNFDANPGEYVLTAYATDGKTVNGTIVLKIGDKEQSADYTVLTNTMYVTNKTEAGSAWSVANGDYTTEVKVKSIEGVEQVITTGSSVTAGRNTFIALKGNSYNVSFIPSEAHKTEGYTTLFKGGTLTFNATVSGKIPVAGDFAISLTKDAELIIGLKFTHFTDFTPVVPKAVEISGDAKKVTFSLADGQVYNYRTWMKDGLTQAGYFTMNLDQTKCPVISFTETDYKAFNPKTINHDVTSNKGYETGDIFVNINAQGHLCMQPGDVFEAHGMRTWELTDNSTNNYFMEPDFHYTILTPDGKPSTGVIEIETQPASAWATIKAIGQGTAIVLVTYDALGVNYYSGKNKTAYLGGEYWGAIWPENTGVYVITVGETATGIKPEMTINEDYNKETQKVAGKYVDAEHDVFYYLDTDEGAEYTFTPQGVSEVTVAYPEIGNETVSYSGFGKGGVTKNGDGSYTLLLKKGRQIVKMTDAAGKSVYQVLTAKPCKRDIVNLTDPGSDKFYPGDKIEIKYSGLFHPANKLAGIYNMSAYITYNDIPAGTSLIQSAGQYTFASAAKAQTVTFTIPADFDASAENAEMIMDKGVIQVNGYGDPIGNHRFINPVAGRSPNFTAIAHKTYFGKVPTVHIPVSIRTSDIEDIASDRDGEPVVYYNMQGVSSDKPFKGMNIIRMSDGSVRKVYIK